MRPRIVVCVCLFAHLQNALKLTIRENVSSRGIMNKLDTLRFISFPLSHKQSLSLSRPLSLSILHPISID